MSVTQVSSLKEWHNQIIDWLLANPTAKQMGSLAASLGVTRSWLSTVMHSDVFVEEYTKRRMAHSKDLSRQLIERQLAIAIKAYDKLELILDDDETDDRLVLDAADKTAKLLGFSPSSGNAPRLLEQKEETVRETTREVAPGVIERARERIRRQTILADSYFNAHEAIEG